MVDLGDDRVLYHVNFTAKIPDESDAVLFFAEVEEAERLRVHVCTMLDANIGKLQSVYKYSSSMVCFLA